MFLSPGFLLVLTYRIFLQDILDEADKDQNGLIDYKEFFDMMQPGPGRS